MWPFLRKTPLEIRGFGVHQWENRCTRPAGAGFSRRCPASNCSRLFYGPDPSTRLSYRPCLGRGFLLAVAVRALLPGETGITLTARGGTLFLAFNRIGYWTCLFAALTVTFLVVGRAALADLGWGGLQ